MPHGRWVNLPHDVIALMSYPDPLTNFAMQLPDMTSPLVIALIFVAFLALLGWIEWQSQAKAANQRKAKFVEANANGPILVRRYKADSQTEALAAFGQDATGIVERGYSLASQTWEQCGFSGAAYLIALLLCPFLIGVPVLLYMLSKGHGTVLTATYERRGPSANSATVADDDLTKTCPRCAESIKAAALVCRYCGQTFESSANG
jgi:Uncharacterised protein family UPF0547